MTHRLFEGKDHASVYQKYRFVPPDEIKSIILQYLDEKVQTQQSILYMYIFYVGIVRVLLIGGINLHLSAD